MRPVAPRTGAPEQSVAEEQTEYCPLTVALYEMATYGPCLLTRWKPTAEERARIARGADIYVHQLGEQLRPMGVHVGIDGATAPEGWRIPEDLLPADPPSAPDADATGGA